MDDQILSRSRDEADVFRNPLGIYVVNFSWSKEFTGAVASDIEPAADSSSALDQESNHVPNAD